MNKLAFFIFAAISLFSCSKSDNASSSNNSTNSSGRLTKVSGTVTGSSPINNFEDSIAYDNNGKLIAFYRKINGASDTTTYISRNAQGAITRVSNVYYMQGLNLTVTSDALGHYQRSVLLGPGYNDTMYYTYTGNKITQIICNKHENGTYQIDKSISTYDANDNMIKDEHFDINTSTGLSTRNQTYESTFDNKQSPFYSIFNLNDYFIIIGASQPGYGGDWSIGQNNVLTARETIHNYYSHNIQYNYNGNNKPSSSNGTVIYTDNNGTTVTNTNITFTY